jgi:uracil-DNA glycosylase family 4
MQIVYSPPPADCPKCPRLCAFREDNKRQYPTFFNGAVPAFGGLDAELLVVGLAPGLKGANQTGRPFTGDYAGLILYSGLKKFAFAKGEYKERIDDGFTLVNCRITNAVRCVPQENKPELSEINNCNSFLKAEIAAMPNLRIIVSLGLVSHNAVLKALGHKAAHGKFAHGAVHALNHNLTLLDSYHCSRYNINTGRLTQAMFDEVIGKAREMLSQPQKTVSGTSY